MNAPVIWTVAPLSSAESRSITVTPGSTVAPVFPAVYETLVTDVTTRGATFTGAANTVTDTRAGALTLPVESVMTKEIDAMDASADEFDR